MIQTRHLEAFKHSRFADAPALRRPVKPRHPVRILNGQMVRVITGIDWLLIGIAPRRGA